MDMSLATHCWFGPWWADVLYPVASLVIGTAAFNLISTLLAYRRHVSRVRSRSLRALHLSLIAAVMVAFFLSLSYFVRFELPSIEAYESKQGHLSMVRLAWERDLWRQAATAITAVLLTTTSLASLSPRPPAA
jgi:hypothetical protein